MAPNHGPVDLSERRWESQIRERLGITALQSVSGENVELIVDEEDDFVVGTLVDCVHVSEVVREVPPQPRDFRRIARHQTPRLVDSPKILKKQRQKRVSLSMRKRTASLKKKTSRLITATESKLVSQVSGGLLAGDSLSLLL